MIPIPKHPNDETRLVAARTTAKALIEDAEVEGDVEEIAADVAKYCRYGDGYQMAKDLERARWDCDMRIAEVLDGHSHTVSRAHEEFLAGFQQEHGIEPRPELVQALFQRAKSATATLDEPEILALCREHGAAG